MLISIIAHNIQSQISFLQSNTFLFFIFLSFFFVIFCYLSFKRRILMLRRRGMSLKWNRKGNTFSNISIPMRIISFQSLFMSSRYVTGLERRSNEDVSKGVVKMTVSSTPPSSNLYTVLVGNTYNN